MPSLNQLIEQQSVRLVALQLVREIAGLLQIQKPSKGAWVDIEVSESPPQSGSYQVVVQIGRPRTTRAQRYLAEVVVNETLGLEPLWVTLVSYGEHQLNLKFHPINPQMRPIHATNMAVAPLYLGHQEGHDFRALSIEERRASLRKSLTDQGLGPWY